MPKLQGNKLNDVTHTNENTFIGVGESGSIVKSHDGGQTWEYQQMQEEASFNAISFPDSTTGYIAATGYGKSKIYKSVDGGENWTKIFDSIPPSSGGVLLDFKKIFFVNDTVGYVTGYMTSLYKTTNGGLTWQNIPFPSGLVNISMIYFLNNDTGFVCGNFGALQKTTNGGLTWTPVSFGIFTYISSMKFVNDTLGYMGASGTKIYKTINGGQNWVLSFQGTASGYIHDIAFTNNTTGIAISDYYIYRTTNGNTWSTGYQGGVNYTSMDLVSSGKYVIVDQYAKIFKSNSISVDPTQINTDAGFFLINKIKFLSSSVGWAAGDNGFLRKTINGGQTWTTVNTTFFDNFNDISFVGANTVYLVTSDGNLIKSTNGGTTWTSQNVSNQKLNAIQFMSSTIGYIAADSGKVYRTNNGGTAWALLQTGTTYNCLKMQFLNNTTGYILLNICAILKTSNGGNTWNMVNIPFCWDSRAMYFTGVDTGYVSDETYKMFKSTDGFATYTIDTICSERITDIYFVNNNNGYAVPSNINSREFCDIMYTSNGGESWDSYSLPYSRGMRSIFALDTSTIYIAGEANTIIRVGENSIITNNKNNFEESTLKIFPNPASQEFTVFSEEPIKFLEVLDINGRSLLSIENNNSKSVLINKIDFSPGIYFVKVKSINSSQTQKIVIY